MLIKSADSRDDDLTTLRTLLQRSDLGTAQRQAIDREVRTLRAGVQGERDAAYELDFHYGNTSTNYAVLHDLRIEHDGRVAQIDHLVIGRFLDVWVCESKNFAEGLAVNEHGEWVGFRQGVPFGIASPIEQNRKHLVVLDSLLKSRRCTLPTRLGFALKPTLHSVILVAKRGQVERTDADVPGLDALMKVDMFFQHQQATVDAAPALSVAKAVGRDTLREFAEQLKRFHRPARTDWYARFGIAGRPTAAPAPADRSSPGTVNGWAPLVPRLVDAPEPSAREESSASGSTTTVLPNVGPEGRETAQQAWMRRSRPPGPQNPAGASACEQCGTGIGADVVRFCRFNRVRFDNRLLCRTCQRSAARA